VRVDGRDAVIVSVREHQGRLLVLLEGVADRTAAELLRGALVEAGPIDREDLDVYLADELVGARVSDVEGRALGVVTALIPLPAAAGYDLLEVTTDDGSTWLLPSVDELVEARDDPDGLLLVVIDPPAGLIDPREGVDAEDGPRGEDG
jgi:16S rRNA processing protein RimM